MKKLPPATPGRCRYCSCTDLRACAEGCEWANTSHTVCSTENCIELHIERGFEEDLLSSFRPPQTGELLVGLTTDRREVVINHPKLDVDKDGVGHIVFSPTQARDLAASLLKYASRADGKWRA